MPVTSVSNTDKHAAGTDPRRLISDADPVAVDDPLLLSGVAPAMPMPETVIGDDDRTKVPDASADPWRRICQLKMEGPRGAFFGTGWFAGARTVITAGHCVHYKPFFRGWAEKITVTPGRNGDEMPMGQAVSTRFSTLDTWLARRDKDFDIGCIHLDEPLGDVAGILPFASLPDDDLAQRFVNIAGYPTDLDRATVQYHHGSSIGALTTQRLFYEADTVSGQSGAPVFILENGAPVVIGIHAYGTPGTPREMGLLANSAPRLTADVFAMIEAWVAQDDAH